MAKQSHTLTVEGRAIALTELAGSDFISLTDMVKGLEDGTKIIENWLRTRATLSFLGAWEQVHNPDFNSLNFEGIMRYAGDMNFTMSVKKWRNQTQAVGIQARAGRYGGTYAHSDIAFEFAMAISPMFKVLLIKEFQRLKREAYSQDKLEWDYRRFLTKANYRLHTDTIKERIIPLIQRQQRHTPEWIVYAEEADILNMAVFGMTAKQWREANPGLAKKGNIRDAASTLELTILANIEAMNAMLIDRKMPKEERFRFLAEGAVAQYRRLAGDERLTQLENE